MLLLRWALVLIAFCQWTLADAAEALRGSYSAQPVLAQLRMLHVTANEADLRRVRQLIDEGATFATQWDVAVQRLLGDVVSKLPRGTSVWQLGDLHLDAHAGQVHPRASADWGDMVIVYLGGEKVNISAKVDDVEFSFATEFGTVLLVPQGVKVFHSATAPVAWLRIRHSSRSLFDFYCSTWIRHYFVAPHQSEAERKFLRAHTRHPVFWHTFIWSFLGVLFSGLAVLPLAWRLLVSIEHHFKIRNAWKMNSDSELGYESTTARDATVAQSCSGNTKVMATTILPTLLVGGTCRAPLEKQLLPLTTRGSQRESHRWAEEDVQGSKINGRCSSEP